MENKKEIIWVYGSLRKTEHNHDILEGSEYLGRGVIYGYKMFSLGAYPFVVPTGNPNDKIFVEGYEVDFSIGNSIECMEIGAGYYKASVDVFIEFGSCISGKIYAKESIHRHYGEVENGDWVKSRSDRYLGGYYG